MAIRKYFLLWSFAILSFLAGALIVVGKARAETIGFSVSDASDPAAPGGAPGDLSVLVVDDVGEKPVEGAQVAVADTLDASMSSDLLQRTRTGADGSALFRGAALTVKAVTVVKDGYSAISLAGVKGAKLTVFLKSLPGTQPEFVGSGELDGWRDTGSDSVQAGLVFRSMSAFDLLHFHSDAFISPLRDTIDVMGPREIPSNLILPRQTVSTLLGPITLNKPLYRLPVPADQAFRFAGLQGDARVSDLMPAFQNGGKFTFDILNQIHFRKVGLTPVLQPTGNFRRDFDAILDLAPKHQVSVDRPPYVADVVVVAFTDLGGDRMTLMPTDVKTAISSQRPDEIRTVNLSGATQPLGQARDVVTMAIGEQGRRISGIVVDQAGKTVRPGAFLNTDALADSRDLPEWIRMRTIAKGMGAVIFETRPADTSAKPYASWMIYTLPEAGEVAIPTRRVLARTKVNRYATTQLEFDAAFTGHNVDGRTVMRKMGRFTRAFADVTGQ